MIDISDEASELLAGGWGQENPPEKIGNTVHREPGERSEFVHKVLEFLDKADYGFAPKFLGMDGKGREIIEFIDGYVPHGQDVPQETWSIETMEAIFKQIRKLHDLTAGIELAGEYECVCHGDLSYANTVYRDGRAIAIIDWDWAHAGTRVEDVAYALLQYLSIGDYEGDTPDERAKVARKLVDAYGLSQEQREGLVQGMLKALMDTRKKQLASARQGKASGKRLVEAGVPDFMLKRHKWLKDNQAAFQKAFAD